MLIRHRKATDVRSSEITPLRAYLDRRRFLQAGAAAGAMALGLRHAGAAALPPAGGDGKFEGLTKGYAKLASNDELTPFEAVTRYNNFYEFGTSKEDPAANAGPFKPLPWTVTVDGACAKPGTLDLDAFLKPHTAEERVYRLRCVEGWSMVIPWVGVSLADVVKRFEPQSSAKFIRFETIVRPQEMIEQRTRNVLPWPYVEGLRLDEATNPLSILAVGLYGQRLPNQNGAPLRLVVPWKYGFKSIKSIVRISFTEQEPKNTWQLMDSSEYGFYANVNPSVDHPRWSQADERRIGEFRRRKTLMFNGYADEVAHLYAGMDLVRFQ